MFVQFYYKSLPFLSQGTALQKFRWNNAIQEALINRESYLLFRKEWKETITQLGALIHEAKKNRRPGPDQASWQSTVEFGRILYNLMQELRLELKTANKYRILEESKAVAAE